jgi:F0F1-type ATP synthase membrane subunit a
MEETGVPGEKPPINHKSLTMSIAYKLFKILQACIKKLIFLELKYIYIKKKKTND